MGQKSSKVKQVSIPSSLEHVALRSRKDELRSLFKKCFKNPLFSLVPFEIWRDLIVSNAELKSIVLLSQTCYAFKEIFDFIGENNFNLALMLRKEGQIDLAKKYLLLCAQNNNSFAMFHLGNALRSFGWGLEHDSVKGAEWLKKSSELGNGHAMAYFSESLRNGYGVEENEELSNVWGKKALLSKNSFAIGFCGYRGYGVEEEYEKSFLCFEASAKEGDDFGQLYLGYCFRFGYGTRNNDEKAFYWYLRAAEQCNCEAQDFVGYVYCDGLLGCEIEEKKAITWYKKAAKQGNKNSLRALKEMGIKME